MTRAPANVSKLLIVNRIPDRITFTYKVYPMVWSLCALSGDEVLFSVENAAPRALLLHTPQLAASDPVVIRNVYRVAFDVRTDTLLLLGSNPGQWE